MYFNKDRIIYGILSIITVNFVNIYMCLYIQGCMFLTMKTGIRVSELSWFRVSGSKNIRKRTALLAYQRKGSVVYKCKTITGLTSEN